MLICSFTALIVLVGMLIAFYLDYQVLTENFEPATLVEVHDEIIRQSPQPLDYLLYLLLVQQLRVLTKRYHNGISRCTYLPHDLKELIGLPEERSFHPEISKREDLQSADPILFCQSVDLCMSDEQVAGRLIDAGSASAWCCPWYVVVKIVQIMYHYLDKPGIII